MVNINAATKEKENKFTCYEFGTTGMIGGRSVLMSLCVPVSVSPGAGETGPGAPRFVIFEGW